MLNLIELKLDSIGFLKFARNSFPVTRVLASLSSSRFYALVFYSCFTRSRLRTSRVDKIGFYLPNCLRKIRRSAKANGVISVTSRKSE